MATRKRPHTVAARVSEREITLIRAAAADAGMNCSEFVAKATLAKARRQLAEALNEDGQAYTPTDLRTIQDWVIKPQLRNIPGVIEVNTIGGYEKQFHVTPHPDKLVAYGLTMRELMESLKLNNANVGAGYIEPTEQRGIECLAQEDRAVDTHSPECRYQPSRPRLVVGNYHKVEVLTHKIRNHGSEIGLQRCI